MIPEIKARRREDKAKYVGDWVIMFRRGRKEGREKRASSGTPGARTTER